MNYSDLVSMISKETKSNVPTYLADEIMRTAIRVVIEEFMTNPMDATLDITGFGKLYLNRRICHLTPMPKFKKGQELVAQKEKNYIRWTVHFTPSGCLKNVLNNKSDLDDYKIAGIPLYPDEDSRKRRGADKVYSVRCKKKKNSKAKKKDEQ